MSRPLLRPRYVLSESVSLYRRISNVTFKVFFNDQFCLPSQKTLLRSVSIELELVPNRLLSDTDIEPTADQL